MIDATTAADFDDDVPDDSAAAGESSAAPVERLRVGGLLRAPIRDHDGLLLLAAGATITAEFKRRLQDRGIRHVRLTPEDRENVVADWETEPAPTTTRGDADSSRTRAVDPGVTRRFDVAVETGLAYVTNVGPKVRDSVVVHGCRRYDPDLRQSLLDRRDSAIRTISRCLEEVASGGIVDGRELVRIAAEFVEQITRDVDCVLSLPTDATPEDALARQTLRMSVLGMGMAVEMGLNADNVRRVGVAGLVHDWGMLRVPRAIRFAPRPLTRIEMLHVHKHPRHTLDLLERVTHLPSLASSVAFQVHEEPDGSGYPRGRHGRSIHLFARILHAADAYVALTSSRPYRAALLPYQALERMLAPDLVHSYDPLALRALLRALSLFPVGSCVTLSDGRRARVLRSNVDGYAVPIVETLDEDEGDAHAPRSRIVDLLEAGLTVTGILPDPIAPQGERRSGLRRGTAAVRR